MFRRRHPLRKRARLAALVWPRSGLRRSLSYVGHRLGRLSESPHRVAAGLAAGTAMAMTPLIGLHIPLACLLALATRGNLLAAVVGTFVANPWTLPMIWLASYRLGLWLLPDLALHDAVPPFLSVFANLTLALLALDAGLFLDKVWPVVRPMLVGGLPLAVLAWIATYAIARSMIAGYRERRRRPQPATAAERPQG